MSEIVSHIMTVPWEFAIFFNGTYEYANAEWILCIENGEELITFLPSPRKSFADIDISYFWIINPYHPPMKRFVMIMKPIGSCSIKFVFVYFTRLIVSSTIKRRIVWMYWMWVRCGPHTNIGSVDESNHTSWCYENVIGSIARRGIDYIDSICLYFFITPSLRDYSRCILDCSRENCCIFSWDDTFTTSLRVSKCDDEEYACSCDTDRKQKMKSWWVHEGKFEKEGILGKPMSWSKRKIYFLLEITFLYWKNKIGMISFQNSQFRRTFIRKQIFFYIKQRKNLQKCIFLLSCFMINCKNMKNNLFDFSVEIKNQLEFLWYEVELFWESNNRLDQLICKHETKPNLIISCVENWEFFVKSPWNLGKSDFISLALMRALNEINLKTIFTKWCIDESGWSINLSVEFIGLIYNKKLFAKNFDMLCSDISDNISKLAEFLPE